MAMRADADCSVAKGEGAPFLSGAKVLVDGKVVHTIEHTPTDDGPWWSFEVKLGLEGDHEIVITDRDAMGREFVVITKRVSCPVVVEPSTTTSVVESTTTTEPTTTEAPSTTEPAATTAPATAPAVPVPVVELAPPPTVADTTTTAVAVAAPLPAEVTTTTTGVPRTLPATGAATGATMGVGSGFLVVGVLLAAVARRRSATA